MKFKAEVEFDDDGASMAGASCGTIRRAEIITVDCESKEHVRDALREKFKKERYFSTIRRIGTIESA